MLLLNILTFTKDKIFDKTFLSGTSEWIYIISFASIIGTPVGIASLSFSFAFSLSTGIILTTGIVKKLLKITRSEKKK